MADFSPSGSFKLFHKDEAKELIIHRESRWLTISLNCALAQMAHNGADSAELKGARRLIDALLNLPDTPPDGTKYPVKELLTFDTQGTIKIEE